MNKYIISLILFSISYLGYSQTNQEALSLTQAIQIALKNNYDILIGEKRIDIATNNDTWGQAGRLPSVNFRLAQNNTISDQSNNPTAFIKETILSNSIQPSIELGWTIFNGFSTSINKEKFEQLVIQSDGNQNVIIENTVQSVILAYYNSLLQRDKMILLDEVLELSKDRLEYNKVRQNIGVASSIDLIQFENSFYTDSVNLMMQKLAYENSLRNLNMLMNVDVNKAYALSDTLTITPTLYNPIELESQMLVNNQNIKNQYINYEILKKDTRLAKANMYPVISINSGSSLSNSRFQIGDFPSTNGLIINYYANFSLSFNLFNGHKTQTQIKNLRVQEEISTLQIDQMKLSLKNNLTSQFDMYNMRLNIYRIQRKTLTNSKKNLDLAEVKYKQGSINSFNYRDIQMQFLNSGISMLETIYQIIEADTEMARLTGGILLDYKQ